jgi:hypothetical protein
MSLAVWIYIIIGTLGMTIAIIEYIKDEIRNRKKLMELIEKYKEEVLE